MHIDIQVLSALFSLNVFKYSMDLDLFIIFLFDYTSTQWFAILHISLLENFALLLCVVHEFGINIMCMFIAWHCAHVHCFLWVQNAHIVHFNFNYFVFSEYLNVCILYNFANWANWVLVLCIVKEFNIEVVYSLCEFGSEHIYF
jgi:hypothetical protein